MRLTVRAASGKARACHASLRKLRFRAYAIALVTSSAHLLLLRLGIGAGVVGWYALSP
ncbi:MAG: hypothetical protein F6K57_34850 [Moorea sp. SIO4A5]|nr:hypothetical protein [Moorena sp. SIO4A5]